MRIAVSKSWRAFYGAAVGALLVLFIHPASRPFLLTALSRWGSSKTFQNNPLVIESLKELPKVTGLDVASVYMQVGAERALHPQSGQAGDWPSLMSVAAHAAQQDPDNAFWVQMQAVLTDAMSKTVPPAQRANLRNLAIEEWGKASHLARWDDYQTRKLGKLQAQLAVESGGPAAWQYAAVYPLRGTAPIDAIGEFARNLVLNLDSTSKSALILRYETLMNGRLIREGSRSIAIGEAGVNMVESASYPKEIAATKNPRVMVITRAEFYNQLVHAGMTDQARQVLDTFKSNEGWLAFLRQENIGAETRDLRFLSVFTIVLPGALLAISLFGGLLWLIAALLRLKPGLMKIVEIPYGPAIGLALAIIVYTFTHLPLASLAVFACFGFLAFTPRNDRSRVNEPLGTAFELVQVILGCVLVILLVGFLVGLSTPGCQVFEELDVPKEFYGGSTLLLGLAGIVVALLSLAAPLWAVIQRIATPSILLAALRQFGRGLFLACLSLAIIATPICVLADRYVRGELGKIVANEPVFYLPS
jgi:hypothetical protein